MIIDTTDKPLVFVVDDDAAVRAAIGSLLTAVGLTVESFASAHEFLDRTPTDAPGCVILDLRLPGTSGLDVQRELAEHYPSLPIIFISGYGDIPTSVRAMKAGALEFLPKPFREQDLLDAITLCLERSRVARRARAEVAELHARLVLLTARERQVMTFVIAGWVNKHIASELRITEVTVKVHRGRVMHKMRAASVPELVRMAERVGVAAAAP